MSAEFKQGAFMATACDKESCGKMFISISSRIRGKSSGGIRIAPDITEHEVASLSKTMALKHGFVGLPIGGAKSGVKTDLPPNSPARIALMKKFGKKFAHLLKPHEYIPGFDMGTHPTDISALLLGAGINYKETNWREVTHIYTAWGLFQTIKETLKSRSDTINGNTIAIEGFGNVGSWLAKEAAKEGAIINAVSTIKGAIVSKNGFDINELTEKHEKYGDDFVNYVQSGEKIDNFEFIRNESHILAPCARFNPINIQNQDEIKAQIIIAGHNMPIEHETMHFLHQKGITYVPGFMANAGGVLGAQLNEFFSDKEIKGVIETSFAQKIRETLEYSKKCDVPLEEIGKAIARKNYQKVKEIEENKSIIDRGLTYTIGHMPKKIGKIFINEKISKMQFT
jgi:glutamate dehydrogenase/leucine dehydrogenase